MNRSLARRITAGLAVALLVAASAAAIPPKAKNAPGSTRVDPPDRLVAYFETNGVDMSRFRTDGTVDAETAEAMQDLYVAEDATGDRIHSGTINAIATGTLATAYDDAQSPVYLEFGPLYWGNWREQDGLSDDD